MKDKDLELVLSEAATLAELDGALLAPGRLPGLWPGDALAVRQVHAYFRGGHAVNLDKGGYEEPLAIPRAEPTTVDAAIAQAVVAGTLWLVNEPASLLGEPIPAGVLTDAATLRPPPAPINVLELLPAALPDAWNDGRTTALALAEGLSRKTGQPLPWQTVRDAIHGAVRAHYLEVEGGWPCEYAAARQVTLREKKDSSKTKPPTIDDPAKSRYRKYIANAEMELAPHEIQDLGDAIPELMDLSAAHQTPLRFVVRIECGDGQMELPERWLDQINSVLEKVKEGWRMEK